jgi:hypothetical protein
MGMANAAAGGLGQYMNYGQQQQQNSLLQQVLNRNSTYGGSGGMTNSGYDFSGISEYG